MALTAGTRLGPHEVTGALGAGGMGEVYRARDGKLNQPFPGPGRKVPVSTRMGRDAHWVRNGRELVYWSLLGDVSIMSVAMPSSPAQPSPPQELFTTTGRGAGCDTRRLALPHRGEERDGVVSVFATVTNWFEELRRRAPAKK